MAVIQHDARLIDHLGMRVHDTPRSRGRYLRYTVSGRGRFPEDMLRYDTATALTPIDESTERREIEVRAHGCTPARWSSFGWSVHSDVKEYRP